MSKGVGVWQELGRFTCCEDTRKSNPGKPGDAAECPHTTEDESENGGNGNKTSSACAVGRDCVQSNRDSQDTRAAHKDPICNELEKFEIVDD